MGNDLLKFKHIYLAGKKVEAQDGKNAIFSLDCLLEDQPLCTKFPILFGLSEHKRISISEFAGKKMVLFLLEDGSQFCRNIGRC